MSNQFEHLRGTQYRGVKELADAVEHIMRSSDTSQDRGTVAEFPNERTIRYYITEGLLPAPVEKSGPSSVYGYQHVLTLLLIKKLQSKQIPISVIKTLIVDKSVDEVEKLLGEDVRVFTSRSELDRYRESTGHTDDSEVKIFAESGPPLTENNDAQEYLESLLFSAKPKPREDADDIAMSRPQQRISMPSLARPAIPEPPAKSTQPAAWHRYEIADGLELNVREDFEPPDNTYPLKQIIERILNLIGRKK